MNKFLRTKHHFLLRTRNNETIIDQGIIGGPTLFFAFKYTSINNEHTEQYTKVKTDPVLYKELKDMHDRKDPDFEEVINELLAKTQ